MWLLIWRGLVVLLGTFLRGVILESIFIAKQLFRAPLFSPFLVPSQNEFLIPFSSPKRLDSIGTKAFRLF
jgi:hypothetical protein